MTTSKRLLALLMALTLCFALCACSGDDTSNSDNNTGSTTADQNQTGNSSTGSDTDAQQSASNEIDIEVDLTIPMYEFASGRKDSDPAITVNGTAIPNELFFYWLSYDCYYMYSYFSSYGVATDFNDETTANVLFTDVQTAITYYACLRQLCQEHGVAITDEQNAEYESQLNQMLEESFGGDMDLLLQSYGLSRESFDYVNTNTYLFNNLADKLVGEPTEADLEQHVADNGIFSVKHILLKTTPTDITDEEGNVTQTAADYNAAQLALAQDLLAQLQAADDQEALFDQLMEEYSEDGRTAEGTLAAPDGYTFTNSDSLVGGFREATLALEVGGLSEVVETDYGYHIMLRLPVDASIYHDAWISNQTDTLISAAMENAEVVLADGLTDLDITEFYNRYLAYGLELYTLMNTVDE